NVLTIPGPPVPTSNFTLGLWVITFKVLRVGFLTIVTKFSGPSTAFTAWLINDTTYILVSIDDGCTFKTTELPAAIIPIALLMIVSLGFVTGVTAPINPNGAFSSNVKPSSPEIEDVLRSSVPGVF